MKKNKTKNVANNTVNNTVNNSVVASEQTPVLDATDATEAEVIEESQPAVENSVTTTTSEAKLPLIPHTGAIPNSDIGVTSEALLASVMMQKYYQNPELAKEYPVLYAEMSRNIDAVVLLGLVKVRKDLLKNGKKNGLLLKVNADEIMPLNSMAAMLGIELQAPMEIEGKSGEKQLAIDFSEAKVPEELEETGSVVEEELITTPSEVKTTQHLRDALAHILNAGSSNKTVAASMIEAIDWYRSYLHANTTSAEMTLTVDNMSPAALLDEIYGLITPSGIVSGLGSSLYNYTRLTQSPVSAYIVLEKHVKQTNPNWKSDEIASLLKVMLENQAKHLNEKREEDKKIDVSQDIALCALRPSVNNIRQTLEPSNVYAKQITGIVRDALIREDNTKTYDHYDILSKITSVYNLFRGEDKLSPSLFIESPKETEKETKGEEIKLDVTVASVNKQEVPVGKKGKNKKK